MSSRESAPRRRRRRVYACAVAAVALLGTLTARLPGSLLVPLMILLLAGVDIVGAVAAKSWAHAPGVWVFLAGSATYVLLFWIYAQSLRHGELTTVTVGWVAVLTVGCMVLDRFHYGVHFPISKWVAAALVVVLLGYLLTDSGSGPAESPPTDDHASRYGSIIDPATR